MTIDEAIKRLEQQKRWLESVNPYLAEAVTLGTEALKRVKACRPPLGRDDHSLLPGETAD